jgi:hypothetical protein
VDLAVFADHRDGTGFHDFRVAKARRKSSQRIVVPVKLEIAVMEVSILTKFLLCGLAANLKK